MKFFPQRPRLTFGPNLGNISASSKELFESSAKVPITGSHILGLRAGVNRFGPGTEKDGKCTVVLTNGQKIAMSRGYRARMQSLLQR